MSNISNTEWLNSNSIRNYPFKEGVSLSNGTLTIPQNFILDAIVSGTNSSLRYRVNYIEVSSSAIQVGFSDSAGTFLGVSNVPLPITSTYLVQFIQPSANVSVRGKFVFGEGMTEVASWAQGRYHFGFSSTELEPSVLVALPDFSGTVTSLSKEGDTENLLTGDVKLKEGPGVSITPLVSENALRIDMAKVFKVDCPDDLDDNNRCESCIKFINGISPDSTGGFYLAGTEFITVEPDSSNNKIKIKFVGDVNACCGACDDVNDLELKLQELQSLVETLQNLLSP